VTGAAEAAFSTRAPSPAWAVRHLWTTLAVSRFRLACPTCAGRILCDSQADRNTVARTGRQRATWHNGGTLVSAGSKTYARISMVPTGQLHERVCHSATPQFSPARHLAMGLASNLPSLAQGFTPARQLRQWSADFRGGYANCRHRAILQPTFLSCHRQESLPVYDSSNSSLLYAPF